MRLNAFVGPYLSVEDILSGSTYWLDFSIDIVFVITIIIKLITAIYRNEKVIKVWSTIVKEYVLKGFFIFDVASTAPFLS